MSVMRGWCLWAVLVVWWAGCGAEQGEVVPSDGGLSGERGGARAVALPDGWVEVDSLTQLDHERSSVCLARASVKWKVFHGERKVLVEPYGTAELDSEVGLVSGVDLVGFGAAQTFFETGMDLFAVASGEEVNLVYMGNRETRRSKVILDGERVEHMMCVEGECFSFIRDDLSVDMGHVERFEIVDGAYREVYDVAFFEGEYPVAASAYKGGFVVVTNKAIVFFSEKWVRIGSIGLPYLRGFYASSVVVKDDMIYLAGRLTVLVLDLRQTLNGLADIHRMVRWFVPKACVGAGGVVSCECEL